MILKNTQLYEIRKVELNHSCTVDDRTGYQSQATHTVIGGMMRKNLLEEGAVHDQMIFVKPCKVITTFTFRTGKPGGRERLR